MKENKSLEDLSVAQAEPGDGPVRAVEAFGIERGPMVASGLHLFAG